jgi:hypothetical protein
MPDVSWSRVAERVVLHTLWFHRWEQAPGPAFWLWDYLTLTRHLRAIESKGSKGVKSQEPYLPATACLEERCKSVKWLELFAESLKRHTKASVNKKVLQGVENVPKGSSRSIRRKQSEWIKGAMSKLDSLVDEDLRTQVLVDTCPHKYPKNRMREMKSKLLELGNLDALLDHMRSDTSWGGSSFYDYPFRDGNIIHVTKVPYNPKAHEAARTEKEKRTSYCHCGLVKADMEGMSPTFCCCSGGWVKQLWEGVLGVPLEVTLTESILKGDERCTHSFQIPPGIL